MVRLRRRAHEPQEGPLDIEFKENPWKRRAVLGLGLVLAAAAGFGTYYVTSVQPTRALEPPPTRQVIVAAQEIAPRTVLEPSMLALRDMPDDLSLLTATGDPTALVGRVTGVVILPNQPITLNLLSTSVAEAEFSILSPTETLGPDAPEWRAVSIMVPKERAVGGMVEVGQRVDLFVTLQINVMTIGDDGQVSNQPDPSFGYVSDRSTKVSFENLELLAKDETADLYVFKVDLHQAEEINHVLAAGNSSFSFALRPDGDGRPIARDGYGETIDRIVEQYGLPLPRIIDIETYPQPQPATPAPLAPAPSPSP